VQRLTIGFLFAGAWLAACGGGNSGSGFDVDGGGGSGSSSGTGSGDDGGPSLVTGDGGPAAALGCSPDLQNVVDSHGVIVKACAPLQGCANGACIDACAAAATSKGSVGCDFLVSTPDFQNQIKPPCFAVFLANNWPRDMKVGVTLAGQTLDATKFARIPQPGQPETSWPTVSATGVPSGQVAVLFMSSDPASMNGASKMTCPVPDAINASTAIAGTGRGQAFHIVTDTPVSAYDIHPYGGAKSFLPSAELLLPTSAWGTNYVAALPKPGDYQNGTVADGPQWAQIIGSVDNTTVKIVPTVALPAGTNVTAAPLNQLSTFTINAGEVIQWQNPWSTSSGPTLEMSGSIISSDKPIAFLGGNGYLCLKSSTNVDLGGGGYGGCDSGHQLVPPVSALPSEYAVAPYATRRKDMAEESIPYRIVGAVDGTTLSYDPPVASGPTSLKLGQVADFEATGAFVVKSQDAGHPFYIGQMMTGGSVTSGSRPGASQGLGGAVLGDEEYVNVPAPAQYLQKYVFFTDPTYPTTSLVIVRKKNQSGAFADVNVDCLGNVSGWKPLGGGGQYETTNVDLLRLGSTTACTNGGHTAKSDGPFGLVVWGLDSFSSYAYPAGGNVATINSVVVPPTPR
jgi:IgGFc binding protein